MRYVAHISINIRPEDGHGGYLSFSAETMLQAMTAGEFAKLISVFEEKWRDLQREVGEVGVS